MKNRLLYVVVFLTVLALPSAAQAQTTIFSDDFSDDTIENPSIAVSVASSEDWGTGSAGGASNAPVAQANGFGGDAPAEDWLITSAMDFTAFSNETLTFISAVGFDDTGLDRGLDVLVSTDYSGSGDPNAATWTDVSSRAVFAQDSDKPSGGSFSPFIASGDVDLSDAAFQGTAVYVAFRYESSGTGGGSSEQWQVDDILIEGTAAQPTLSFTSSGATVGEADGSTSITVEIQGVDGSSVSADVVLAGGSASAADLGSYTTQTVTFPSSASDGDTQSITVNITDDTEIEGDEDAVFSLQNASGAVASASDFTLTITDDDNTLVINEILADPASGTDGDANQDGTRDGSEDEFVEIYNTGSQSIDLTDFVIEDGFSDRHTFPAGTTLPAGTAIVVFGGGSPAASIPGTVQTASSGSLGLNNSGDTVTLLSATGGTVTSVSYGGEGGNNESLTRSPDFTGSFVQHSTAAGSGGALFSPGRTVDGSALPVELTAFDAQFTGTGLQLTWTTLSETNNAGFEVQHKAPGASAFQAVSFVEGMGTTTEVSDYRFFLSTLEPGTHVVRLRQMDVDGGESFSEPQSVRVTLDPVTLTGPNPAYAGADVKVVVQTETSQDVEVSLYNVLGQRVQTLYDGPVAPERAMTKAVNVSTLPSGMYFVRVNGETIQATRKLSVVR